MDRKFYTAECLNEAEATKLVHELRSQGYNAYQMGEYVRYWK